MMDERSTIFVVATRAWFDCWASMHPRRERGPRVRHIGPECMAAHGLLIRPFDRVIYGDTMKWDPYVRRCVAEGIAVAQLAGEVH